MGEGPERGRVKIGMFPAQSNITISMHLTKQLTTQALHGHTTVKFVFRSFTLSVLEICGNFSSRHLSHGKDQMSSCYNKEALQVSISATKFALLLLL